MFSVLSAGVGVALAFVVFLVLFGIGVGALAMGVALCPPVLGDGPVVEPDDLAVFDHGALAVVESFTEELAAEVVVEQGVVLPV